MWPIQFVKCLTQYILLNTLSKKITSYKELITFVKDRPGHDRRYAIDPTKIETELGWKARENFEDSLFTTVQWYVEKYI